MSRTSVVNGYGRVIHACLLYDT